MSLDPHFLPHAPTAHDTQRLPELARLTTFYWLVRRELWEHRAVYIAPAAIATLGLVGLLIRSLVQPNAERAALLVDAVLADDLMQPYNFLAGTVLFTGIVVAALYSLAALHSERRDRSILFWKSQPVSDRMTVLSKAAIPLVIMPTIVLAVVVVGHLVLLALTSLIWAANGFDPSTMWMRMNLPFQWLVLGYALSFMVLWHAPLYGGLLLASVWAHRMPILWAAAPVAAIAIVGRLVPGSSAVASWLEHRFIGGFLGFFTAESHGEAPVRRLAELNPVLLFGQADVWTGLLFAVLFLYAAIRLRRTRPPI